MFSHLVLVTVFKVFSFGRVVLNTLLIVFPLHKTLVTTLAKNLVKNLAKKLVKNLGGLFGFSKGLIGGCLGPFKKGVMAFVIGISSGNFIENCWENISKTCLKNSSQLLPKSPKSQINSSVLYSVNPAIKTDHKVARGSK